MKTRPAKNHEFRQQLVLSKDGTAISHRSFGTGTSLVVIPGALGMAMDFDDFARELALFTWWIGGDGGAQGGRLQRRETRNARIFKRCARLQTATLLFGHSNVPGVAAPPPPPPCINHLVDLYPQFCVVEPRRQAVQESG